MAQTGFTPIQIYSSSTATNTPLAANLNNSTLGSELAINITDGKLFYKDNSNVVQVIGWKTTPTTAGGTGLTSYSAGDLLYYASGTTLSKLAIGSSGSYISSSGTAPQWSAPAALTKTNDTNVTLTLGGSASTALLNAASLTLGWTGQLAVSRGGTGAATFTAGCVLFGNTTSAINTSANLFWDNTNARLGVNTSSPGYALEVQSADTSGTAAEVLRLRALGGSNDYVDQTFFARGAFMSNPVVRLRGYLTYGVGGNESGQFVVATVSGGVLTDQFAVRSDGIIISPATYSSVVGATNRDVYVDSGGYLGYVSSTRESKDNIKPLDDVSWLSQLQCRTFNRRKRNAQKNANGDVIMFKDGYSNELYDETEYGLVFDEVEPINSEICFYDDQQKTKPAGVSYSKLIVPLLKKVQQLEAEIKAMKGTE
jgi:hypothetical protein